MLIENSWLSYRDLVLPAEASASQLLETRRAFYAGAASLFIGILGALDPRAAAMPADLELMESIDAELKAYSARVKRGLE